MIKDYIFERKIPNIEPPKFWEKHEFIDSAFVEIPQVIKFEEETKINLNLQYPQRGMKNAINKCLIRKEALERLLIACTYLPKGIAFKILDIYRPWGLQNELYYAYKPDIIKQFKLERLPKEDQEIIVNNYVAIPSKNKEFPPAHTTGGAIDLTITNLDNGEDLNIGIEFDAFSDLTNTTAYENKETDETIKNNRRLLYNIMTSAGFSNLPSEIWHYDYGDKNWGYYEKKPAIYNGVFEIDEITSIISFEDFIKGIEKNDTEISMELKKYQWRGDD